MADKEVKWSHDEEVFNADSLAELIADNGLKAGDTVWFGETKQYTASDFVDADCVIDAMRESAYDAGGEHAEDFPDVTDEAMTELVTLLSDWADKHITVSFWGIDNAKAYVITAGDTPRPSSS